MVTAFALDSMHTIDGGTAKDFLLRLIEPLKKDKKGNQIGGVLTQRGRAIVDRRFAETRAVWIDSTARYLRYAKFKCL